MLKGQKWQLNYEDSSKAKTRKASYERNNK